MFQVTSNGDGSLCFMGDWRKRDAFRNADKTCCVLCEGDKVPRFPSSNWLSTAAAVEVNTASTNGSLLSAGRRSLPVLACTDAHPWKRAFFLALHCRGRVSQEVISYVGVFFCKAETSQTGSSEWLTTPESAIMLGQHTRLLASTLHWKIGC